MDITTHKYCAKCLASLPIIQFSNDRSRPDGRSAYCRRCDGQKVVRWQQANPEKTNTKNKQWLEDHPGKASEYQKRYYDAHTSRVSAKHHRGRAQRVQAFVEEVDPQVVYARDQWICQLCHKKVNPRTKGLEGPSLDHVIPIAEGGTHCYQNCVLVHHRCNLRKGKRHNFPQQQRLF